MKSQPTSALMTHTTMISSPVKAYGEVGHPGTVTVLKAIRM